MDSEAETWNAHECHRTLSALRGQPSRAAHDDPGDGPWLGGRALPRRTVRMLVVGEEVAARYDGRSRREARPGLSLRGGPGFGVLRPGGRLAGEVRREPNRVRSGRLRRRSG